MRKYAVYMMITDWKKREINYRCEMNNGCDPLSIIEYIQTNMNIFSILKGQYCHDQQGMELECWFLIIKLSDWK